MGNPGLTTASAETITRNRSVGYVSLQKRGALGPALLDLLPWASILLFLASAPGAEFLEFTAWWCTAGANPDDAASGPLAFFFRATLAMAASSIVTYLPLAMSFESVYAACPERRCQTKTRDVSSLRRPEVRLALQNLVIAAALTVGVGLTSVIAPGAVKVSMEPVSGVRGWAYLLSSTVGFFVWIDLWAYVAHRLLHMPLLYRTVHKTHHQFAQPTAFAGMGLHWFEFTLIQMGVYAAFL